MRPLRVFAGAVVLVALLGFGATLAIRHLQDRALTRKIAALRREGDSLRLHFAVETVTVTKWNGKWREAKALQPPDTLPVPPRVVREIIAAGDSAINSCGRALHDCDRLQALEHARGDSLERQVALLRGRPFLPSLALPALPRVSGWVGGYLEGLMPVDGGHPIVASGVAVGTRFAVTVRGELELSDSLRRRLYVGGRWSF